MRVPNRKPGKFSNLLPGTILTQSKFQELSRELEKLKKIKPQAASEVARLAELGDFSENVEYQMAKGRLRGINNAILKLEYQLDNAEIIDIQSKSGVVVLGSTVVVLIGEKEKRFQILGSSETDPKKGVISNTSPLGAALIGKSIGDSFVLNLSGNDVMYKVVAII